MELEVGPLNDQEVVGVAVRDSSEPASTFAVLRQTSRARHVGVGCMCGSLPGVVYCLVTMELLLQVPAA